MITDSYFRIGSSHHVCQDYAMHGECFSIIADGCSSGGKVDFGARLYAQAAANFLQENNNVDSTDLLYMINNNAKLYANIMLLDEEDLLSTLGVVRYNNTNNTSFLLFGDGSVLVEYEHCYIWHHIHYDNNMPYYPIYFTYKNVPFNYPIITLTEFDKNFNITTSCKYQFGSFYYFGQDIKVKSVFVFTDGLDSFQDLSPIDIFREITALKIKTTNCLTRRCNKFFKQCDKSGIKHTDDFAVAAIIQ